MTEAASEGGHDRPSDTGAASDGIKKSLRAQDQRGGDKNQRPVFYGYSSQKPADNPPEGIRADNANSKAQGAAQRQRLAELRETAHELLATPSDEAGDDSLGPLLAAIADDVQQNAGMARAGIMGNYSARVVYARRHMKGPALAGILQALKTERDGALAALAEKTAGELKGRLAAARIMMRRSRPGGPSKT